MSSLFRSIKNFLALVLAILLVVHLVFDRSYPITPFWMTGWLMIPGVVAILLSAVVLAESLKKPHEEKERTIIRVVIGIVLAVISILLPFDIWGAFVSLILAVAGWKKADTKARDSRHLTVWLSFVLFFVFGWFYGGALIIFNIRDVLSLIIAFGALIHFQFSLGVHLFSGGGSHGATAHP